MADPTLQDHTTIGLGRLPADLNPETRPRLKAFFEAFLGQFDDFEGVAFEVLTERTLVNAVGAQLDTIGAIVGAQRVDDATDDLFRRVVRCTILVNRSQGKAPQLYEICRLFYGAADASDFRVRDYYPADFEVWVDTITFAYAVSLARLLRRAKPAAVGFQLVATEGDDTTTFRFSDSATVEDADTSTGFDWTEGYGIGGRFAFSIDGSF